MKVNKIPPPSIPRSHYKWAGIEVKEEKNNDLDPKKIDRLVRKVYHQKYGTYNKNGEFVAHEDEAEVQDWHTPEDE